MNTEQPSVAEEKERIMRVLSTTICVVVITAFGSTMFGATLSTASTIIVGACTSALAVGIVALRRANRRNTKGAP